MHRVTSSAGYGAGGSFVAPEVAKRLGLPLLDRAISSRVAAQLRVSVQEAEGGEARRPLVERVLSVLTPLAGGPGPAPIAPRPRPSHHRMTRPPSASRPRPS